MKEFLIGAAGIVLAGAALAQTAPAPPAVPLAAPTPDRIQTRDEVVARVREHFAQLDTNRDGSLTKAEAEAGRKVVKDRFRQRLGERRNSPRAGRDPGQAFDRLDTNKDGTISREEFGQARERRVERRIVNQAPGAAAPVPEVPHQGLRMHGLGGMRLGGHMFDMADANKDGRVTLQEATDAAVRHFDMADANRDGRITPDERSQRRHQIIEKRRAPKAG